MAYWHDKVAVVTGGSSGLGRAIAEAFAFAGARVVIAARHADTLNTAAEEIRRRVGANCPEILTVPTDVTRQPDVEALFQQTLDRFGRLDVLVNNAGRSDRGQVLDTTPEEFEELLELNFLSVVRCTRAAAPQLIKSRGHLVNIGSLASKTASRFVGAYPASKFALAAYTQQLRLELSPEGLHVLFVCPGPIITDEPGNHRPSDTVEGIPDHAKKPGAGVKLGAVHAKDLAAAILRACEHGKTELVYPRKARVLFMLNQLSPRLGDWLLEDLRDTVDMTDRARQNRLLTWAIMGGVLVWGLMLAIGAAVHSAGFYNFDLRRGLIVFACVLAFLGFWVLMLRHRARSIRDDEPE